MLPLNWVRIRIHSAKGDISVAKKAKARQTNKQVEIDRRKSDDRRGGADRRQKDVAVERERRTAQRRLVNRRRQIDPTTCERDYTQDEIEFMQAMDAYKRSSGRMFPTCSEVLEVVRNLGYEKRSAETVAAEAPANSEPDGPPCDDTAISDEADLLEETADCEEGVLSADF